MQDPPRTPGSEPDRSAPADPRRAEGAPSAFERLGGEAALRPIIDRFVDRVVSDTMIGFFFRSVDIAELKRREYEFAAAHLGGPVRYTGRPLGEAHGRHPILGGQFNRRLKILENTLLEFNVPEEVRRAWLEHNARLRSVITRDHGDECILPPEPNRTPGPEENE